MYNPPNARNGCTRNCGEDVDSRDKGTALLIALSS
jgi:hypothetical protein